MGAISCGFDSHLRYMLKSLNQLDGAATEFLYRLLPHNQFLDAIFAFLSLHGNLKYLWVVVLLILARKFLYPLAVNSLFVFALVEILLKNIFGRARPEAISAYCEVGFAFPSGHSAVAFAAATVFASNDKKRAWIYYLVATLVAFSRIYLGCHYLGDILAGALVGYFISKKLIQPVGHHK